MGNPFEFDDEEYGGDEEDSPIPTAAHVDRLVAGLSSPPLPEDEMDESYMSQVDERLEVTTHYRILLQGSLFDSDSPAARIVEREVRRYVRNRVEVLLGIRPEEATPAAPPLFTDSELTALKALAAAAMRSPSLGAKPAIPKVEPQIRRAAVPVAKPAPAIVPRILKPAPVARQQPAPAAPPVLRAKPPIAPQPAAPPPAQAKGGRKRGFIKKTVADPVTGKDVEITKVEQQNPADRLPWPSEQAMTMLTAQQAGQVVSGTANDKVTSRLVHAAMNAPVTNTQTTAVDTGEFD